jgi:ABC-type antimicrobial peptide transport system permease subunit
MNSFANSRGVAESFNLFSYPWWLIAGMILFMVIVGMLVVYFPARRAMKINPIDALRRE